MKQFEVSAKVPAKGDIPEQSATVYVNGPENLEEAIDLYGEDAVLSNALANWRITLQGNIRSGLRKGETPESIQERLTDAKMGVSLKKGAVDPMAAFLAKFQAAPPEERAKMLEALKAKMEGLGIA